MEVVVGVTGPDHHFDSMVSQFDNHRYNLKVYKYIVLNRKDTFYVCSIYLNII